MFPIKMPDQTIRNNNNISQFGLTDLPDDFDPTLSLYGEDVDNDSDLEAELAAITGETNGATSKSNYEPNPEPANDIDPMITECLKDVTDGEDENNSQLLVELQDIVGNEVDEGNHEGTQSKSTEREILISTTDLNMVDLLKKRIQLYTIAEANAKTDKENSKIRRFNRGLKTLNELLKQSYSGKMINLGDIPPEVSVKMPCSDNIMELNNKAGKRSNKQEKAKQAEKELLSRRLQVNPLIEQMRFRQNEYKIATLQSKRDGDTVMALQFLKIFKQFDIVLKMLEDGQDIDLSDMPPPPSKFKEYIASMTAECELKQANAISLTVSSLSSEDELTSERNIKGTNMLEALIQRLSKYKSVEESATAEGNYSKARRYGRIVKQYEDAIRAYKAGRPVSYDDLPVPPGFGLLPIETTKSVTSPKVESEPSSLPTISATALTPDPSPKMAFVSPDYIDLTTRKSGNQQKNNLAEQQMKILLQRQKEFKIAAIEAKKAGEIEQAKEYLKIYKGFSALLNAASCGLPVDLNTLPVPPAHRDFLEASFAMINTEECDPNDDISDIGFRIEEQLAKQLMMCKNTRDHHKALGDIAGLNRFENLALIVQKDLDFVRYSKRNNFPLPKFHYEKRSFNIVHCNTDLNDNELEIIVVRGIKYNVTNPKEVDTYVKVEFPLLNDEIFRTKTNIVKDTDSPNYDQHFKVEILRGNRQFQRIFKRQRAKFEVYSRGGFLRSDTQIGTINVKLQTLETNCDIHDTFDLVEGRKKVGGKLEIKLRVRNPILNKQMERIDEKWLVTDM